MYQKKILKVGEGSLKKIPEMSAPERLEGDGGMELQILVYAK